MLLLFVILDCLFVCRGGFGYYLCGNLDYVGKLGNLDIGGLLVLI